MKKHFKDGLRVVLPIVLACVILAGCLSNTANPEGSGGALFTDVTGTYSELFSKLMMENFGDSVLKNETTYETKTVVISLSQDCLADCAGKQGVSAYLETSAGQKQLSKIRTQQDKLLKALDKAGIEYQLKYRYTAVDNAIAVTVDTSYVSQIKKMSGVESVVISRTYSVPKTTSTDSNGSIVKNATDVYKTGVYDSSEAFALGYDGSGMVVAIIDTGLDFTHSAFQTMPNQETLGLTKDQVAEILANPNITLRATELNGGSLSVDDIYHNDKVPFMFDYADNDVNVYPSYSNHGTHVAGIVAGYNESGYTDKDGNHVDEPFIGVAPNAQLVICKVFTDDLESSDLGGAETEDILAALEDCVYLGVDVINMSLGTTCGFTTTDDGDDEGEYLNRVYSMVGEAGISLVCAASNDYSAGFGGTFGTNLSTNPDSGTVGSPSTFGAALSVASISGKMSNYLYGNGTDVIFFQNANDGNSNPFDFIEDMLDGEGKATFEYVVVPGTGGGKDYTESIRELIKGRIALVKRGDSTFQEKVELASANGAIGIIIWNNVAGTVRMSLGDVEEDVYIPSISIDMESGQKLVNGANENRIGTLEISGDYQAGPFMSDFSSWGATSDLKLKPEITAHGGEITSTVPGGYGEQSGTSMASPNMAGVVALLRSYVERNFTAEQLDALKKSKTETQANVINRLVNQILMSTANIVLDEDGLPYSPRKQGAGLGSLHNALYTGAYLWTDNAENDYRPKYELGDDPDKDGVYTIRFHITNFGDTALSFKTQSVFMTETLAVDGMAVAEQAHLLTDNAAQWTVDGKKMADGETFTVPSGATYEITMTVSLSDAEKAYIDTSFANGMYVEGFARLISVNGESEQSDLILPYMGFYGDWNDAPMLDYDAYELGEYQKDSSILDDEKPQASVWATQPYVSYQDEQFTLPMGSFLYLQDENADQIYAQMEHNSISCYDDYFGEDSTDNYLTSYKFRGLYAGLLRNARYVDYTLTNTDTGEVLETDTVYRVGKAYAGAGSAAPAFVKFDTDPVELGLVSGEQYTMTFDFYFDYENEDRTGKKETYSFSFYADYEAPVLQDVRVRYYEYKENNKTKQKIYLDLDVYDNHYAQSVMLTYLDKDGEKLELKLATEYVTPVQNANKNGTTTVSIDITDIYEDYKDKLYVQLDDYALNHSNYWLNLSAANLSVAPDEFELAEGEDAITLNIYGSHTVQLENFTGNGTLSNFDWSSNNRSVAEVKNGEIVGLSVGTATITVTGSGGARRSIKVTVTDTVEKLPTPSISFGTIRSGSGSLTGGYVDVYPGDNFTIDVNTDPWYYPEGKFTLKWTSSNPEVATVDQNGTVTTLAEGQASILATIVMDGKETNYAASMTLNVQDPFVVSGVSLTEYHGVGDENGVVVIPTDKNIMMISESAFENNDKITKVIIPKTVMSIGKYAFRNCTALEEVYFDTEEKQEINDCDINIIYQEAFAGCTSLRLVDFTNVKIVSLGRGCFRDCTSLTQVRDMAKATTMYDGVFSGCTSLKEVDLSGLFVSGSEVFGGCTSLSKVTTGYATNLGDYIFKDCKALKTITISGTKVGDYAFNGCINLTSVIFAPAQDKETSNTSIGVRAFAECTKLKTVTFKDGASVWSIGDYAFRGCTALKKFTMPSGLTVLGNDILAGSGVTTIVIGDDFDFGELQLSGLTFGGLSVELAENCTAYVLEDGVIYNREKTKLLAVTGDAKVVTIPETVETIGAYAFAGTEVAVVHIPANVKTIGTAAFANSALKKITFADDSKIKAIPANAFYGSRLSEIVIPASVETIGEYAFAETALSLIRFAGNNVTEVGDCAFANCALLVQVVLPDGISRMGDGVFMNCTQLVSATMPSVRELGVETFYGCSELTTVIFGKDAQTLGDSRWLTLEYGEDPILVAASTFYYCDKLTTVVIGERVKRIDETVFAGCTALERIDLKNVTKIGDYAFYGCTGLKEVVALDRVETVGDYAFYACNGLTKLDLASAKTIGEYAFAIEKGNAYTEIYIPVVEQIGNMAFVGGTEKTVTIPKTLTKLGYGVFSYSKNLQAITVEDGNERFFALDGVLFRRYLADDTNGVVQSQQSIELCAFPGGKSMKGQTYVVPDGTTRIDAYAFAGLGKNAPETVVMPWSLHVVGVSAFYESGILDYEFQSVQAPILATVRRDDVYELMDAAAENTTMDMTAVNGLFYANFNELMVYYTELLGGTSNLSVRYPANGVGYDNYVWKTYFATRETTEIVQDDTTREAIAAIEALTDPEIVNSWDSWDVNDAEKKALLEAFSEQVTDARRKYNNVTEESQLAMIDEALVEKLVTIETQMRTLKQKFGIALKVMRLTYSGDFKREYVVGDVFDMTNLVLVIEYTDYSREQVDMTKVTAPTEALGRYDTDVILVYKDGEVEYSWTIAVTIKQASSSEEENPGQTPGENPGDDPKDPVDTTADGAGTVILVVAIVVVVVAGCAVAFVLLRKKKAE